MSRKVGLPTTVKFRNDAHFVDALTGRGGASIGRMLPIQELKPNPNQPRQQMGDLSDLTASIKEKGILEPLIVRRVGESYQIISGERRYQAAIQAGLSEVPCVERDVDDDETLELALIENIQRKDLTPLEEADAYNELVTGHGYTHEALAQRIGKARTSVTETLSLSGMPQEIRELCRLADITSKSLLLQIVRQDTVEKMTAFIETISRENLTRDGARQAVAKRRRGRPKNFVFKYGGRGNPFRLQMTFRKSDVDPDEIIESLHALIADLEAQKATQNDA